MSNDLTTLVQGTAKYMPPLTIPLQMSPTTMQISVLKIPANGKIITISQILCWYTFNWYAVNHQNISAHNYIVSMDKMLSMYQREEEKMKTFADKAYDLLRKVPKGRVTTYKEIAHALETRAYRGVGQAMRRNPYAPEVP